MFVLLCLAMATRLEADEVNRFDVQIAGGMVNLDHGRSGLATRLSLSGLKTRFSKVSLEYERIDFSGVRLDRRLKLSSEFKVFQTRVFQTRKISLSFVSSVFGSHVQSKLKHDPRGFGIGASVGTKLNVQLFSHVEAFMESSLGVVKHFDSPSSNNGEHFSQVMYGVSIGF